MLAIIFDDKNVFFCRKYLKYPYFSGGETLMKTDNHIHSPFCPHGSTDSFDEYINRGIELGLTEITLQNMHHYHKIFIDPTPEKDSGMDAALLS